MVTWVRSIIMLLLNLCRCRILWTSFNQPLKNLFQTQTSMRAQIFSNSQAAALKDHISYGESPNSVSHAHRLFDEIPELNVTQYHHLLFEYSRNNFHLEALRLILCMFRLGFVVDGSSLSCVLKVSGVSNDHSMGRQLHCHCIKSGFAVDVSVGTSLVDMYMKTNNVIDGWSVFGEMKVRNVVSWTSLLVGFALNGFTEQMLDSFYDMQIEGVKPNAFTFAALLGGVADNSMAETGTQFHALAVKNGLDSNTYVGNSMINMYLRSEMVEEAKVIFNGMLNKDATSWNSFITGLVIIGLDFEALDLFLHMRLKSVKMTQAVFATMVKACANVKELSFARQLQCQIMKSGFESGLNVMTSLMLAYSKCSDMVSAIKIFKTMQGSQNVVSMTAMITGCLQNGENEKAMHLFLAMSRESIRPNEFTYSAILTAHPCASPFQLHAQIIRKNYDQTTSVGTALLNAYLKTGHTGEAVKVFELMGEKDTVAWSAMLSGHGQVGDTDGAIGVFLKLAEEGIMPNEYTFSSVINACAGPLASTEQGKQFHALSIKSGSNDALCVSSALVTMYAKSGNIDSANEVFKRQGEKDLVSWNSMISGYAQHGKQKEAIKIFEEMQRQNIEIDGITFVGVISACTHTGLVEEGQKYYDLMVKEYHVDPTMEHYACMVDLYSRAGLLDKAMDLINGMPFPAGATIWRTLLGACHVQRNVEMGKVVAEKLISLQPQDSAAYVLLSNLHAATGHWPERDKIRRLMDKRQVKKEAGYSWIEVKNKTYSFLAGDHSHPLSDLIYSKLEEVSTRLRDAGHQPDTNYVLHDVEDEHKEVVLSQHSERLAIAFGLIVTPPGSPIQIVKNLRVCGDCHTVIKLISLFEERIIIVRDSNRFHHFKGGVCSCGDFW